MKPNCFKCKHFYISHDPSKPRGCKAFQIKSAKVPSIIVKEANGTECMAYTPKSDSKKKESFLDSKFW